jgi:hypothetical protein
MSNNINNSNNWYTDIQRDLRDAERDVAMAREGYMATKLMAGGSDDAASKLAADTLIRRRERVISIKRDLNRYLWCNFCCCMLVDLTQDERNLLEGIDVHHIPQRFLANTQ